MKCSDLQSNLALYADGLLDEIENSALSRHLDACPLCRQKAADYREMRAALRQMRMPEISVALKNTIKREVRTELRIEKHSLVPVSSGIREWLQMRVMPYGVGVVASVLVGMTFMTMMFSGMLTPGPVPIAMRGRDASIMLAANTSPYKDQDTSSISPSDYAKTRLGLGNESPSVNPQGALIALTKSLVRGGMKDDEVVVVADVFDNGLAQIAEVVEPSRDRKAVGELQKALDSDPTYAPFIPSTLENRPQSVRVILKFQSVDVRTDSKPGKHRL
ncbi:MAG: zf-HC2 domain-containing protein [Acidobacteriota bacterium]